MSSTFFLTPDGNPEGGHTYGTGFSISWQRGPLQRGTERLPPNGAFVEDIIQAAFDRLTFFQDSRFACAHNAEALQHLRCALNALETRTKEREQRKVEGTWTP